MNRSVTIIANPASGGASAGKLEAASKRLEDAGLTVEVRLTERPGDGTRLAHDAASSAPDFIIAAGGDGTFNEVINGIAGTGVPMALLPLGTANVLPKELGIPEDIRGAVDAAIRGRPRPVSLGKIEAGGGSRYFCLMAGIGFDAAAVYSVNTVTKRFLGKAAFVTSGIRVLSSWDPGQLLVRADGTEYRCRLLIASNSRKYAGHFDLAPGADITEPRLHLFLFHGRGRIDILRYAALILAERTAWARDITQITCRSLTIEGNAHVQVDGDYLGTTPASITAVPGLASLIA
jgi:YegS/Rv2252/BmrU family lipid kinase